MVSTAHSATMVQVTDKRDNTKFKPEVVAEYNHYMHGVDNADQYLFLYPFMRKTVKCPKSYLSYSSFHLVLHNKGTYFLELHEGIAIRLSLHHIQET